ncbi:MAG: zinc-ribbon domain-containing protein [Bacillota bacterium]
MAETTCPSCGAEIETHFNVCPFCGHSLKSKTPSYNEDPEASQVLWGLLGFFVPVAGLVLYLVWEKERPRTAKAAGMGALIGVIIGGVGSMFGLTMMFGVFGRGFGMM